MSKPTLHYFNVRARGELVRLIFAAAGVEYDDHRIDFAEWPELKAHAPLGQLPYLQVGDVKVPQSIAIARYAARETNLAGEGNLQQAQADAIVDTVMELVNSYYKNVFSIKDAAEKEAAFKQFMESEGQKGAASIEKLISLYGSNGHAVGSNLTWADILIFDVAAALFNKHPQFATDFPQIAAVHHTVEKHEKIAEYVKNRPITPF